MARVPQSDRVLAEFALSYVQTQLRDALTNLRRSQTLINELTASGASFDSAKITAFKNELLTKAKTSNTNAVKMYRWMFEKLSISIPSAFTDIQVDAINPNIRTREVP